VCGEFGATLASTVYEYRVPVRHVHLKRADFLCHRRTPENKPDSSGTSPRVTCADSRVARDARPRKSGRSIATTRASS
jgi:hypothetical protein